MLEQTLSLATVPRHALTVADYLALPEDSDRHYEVVEGNLVMAARPTPSHGSGQLELLVALRASAPTATKVLPQVDVDVQLVAPDGPATVRAPDVVVVTRDGYDLVDLDDGPSLIECRLVDGGYVETLHTGVVVLDEPFPVTVDLGGLV